MILPLSGFASCTKEVQGKAFKAKSSEKSTSFPLEFNHQAVKPSISHPFTLQERRPPSHRSSSGRVIFLHQVACQEVRTGGQSPWLRKKRRKHTHTHTHLHLSPSLSISLCLCLSFSLKSLCLQTSSEFLFWGSNILVLSRSLTSTMPKMLFWDHPLLCVPHLEAILWGGAGTWHCVILW